MFVTRDSSGNINGIFTNQQYDGQEYLEGAVLYVPAVIATTVTMKQARLALLQQGLLVAVNTAIAAMTGTAGQQAQIEWEFSATVDRKDPLVVSLTSSLGGCPRIESPNYSG